MKGLSVSLVFPMFNEIDNIDRTISTAISVCDSCLQDYEIVIVDDASYDGSERIADSFSVRNDHVRVIHHAKNRKLGGTLKTGFQAVSKEIVLYTDIDMPFDLTLLKELLPLIDGGDILVGYRIGARESLKRSVYSKLYNFLIRIAFGLKVRDVNFALKIFRKSTLNSLKLTSEGSFINAEALIKAQRLGYKIQEVPVLYTPRKYGRSRLSSLSVIFKILYEMLKFFPKLALLKVKKKRVSYFA